MATHYSSTSCPRWRRAMTTALLAGTLVLPSLGRAQTTSPPLAQPPPYAFLACEPVTDVTPMEQHKVFVLVPCRTDAQLLPIKPTTTADGSTSVLAPEPIPTPLTPLPQCLAPLYILDMTETVAQWSAWVPPVPPQVPAPEPVVTAPASPAPK